MKPTPTKDRIFWAVRELFDREGEAGVSMRRIADAVGITPMAIYKHYADKDALLSALMLDGLAAWQARVEAIAEAEPLPWLERVGDEFLEFALAEPRRYEAAFLLAAGRARQYPHDFAAGRSPVLRMVHARIEQARERGQFGEASAVEAGLSLSALGQGLVAMYRAGRFASEADFRASYRRALRHCLSSFARGAGQ